MNLLRLVAVTDPTQQNQTFRLLFPAERTLTLAVPSCLVDGPSRELSMLWVFSLPTKSTAKT